jgi:hypothetical protein
MKSAKLTHIEKMKDGFAKIPLSSPMIFDLGTANISKSLSYIRNDGAHECLMKNHRGGRAWAWAIASSICHHGSQHSYFTESKAPGKPFHISVQKQS